MFDWSYRIEPRLRDPPAPENIPEDDYNHSDKLQDSLDVVSRHCIERYRYDVFCVPAATEEDGTTYFMVVTKIKPEALRETPWKIIHRFEEHENDLKIKEALVNREKLTVEWDNSMSA